MELLADRDPEEARKLLDPVLERMMEAVHRYEGTVNQVMGDGIMALFGAPLAHEDHAVRACYAALRHAGGGAALRRGGPAGARRRRPDPRGPELGRGGRARHRQRPPHGLHRRRARRRTWPRGWSSWPSPGTILLTADTLRLAEGYVEVKPLGPVPVKGLRSPRRGVRAGRGRRRCGPGSRRPRPAGSPASSAGTPRSSSSAARSSSAAPRARAGRRRRRRAGRRQVPPRLGVHPLPSRRTAGWSSRPARSPTARRRATCR